MTEYIYKCDSSSSSNPPNIHHCLTNPFLLPVHTTVQEKLDIFLKNNKVPHIIFHGNSGVGKRTIVYDFLNKIYNNDKYKLKTNVMHVNCSHFKGIKFIREELKFFAKINIQPNSGINFKTIVLLNADYLTIDAQSALRRCIELYSFNTRFFIIVENKYKLLNPILSRFCEIYIPNYIVNNQVLNLYQNKLNYIYDFKELNETKMIQIHTFFANKMIDLVINENDGISKDNVNITHIKLTELSAELYEAGLSAIDMIKYIGTSGKWTEIQIIEVSMEYYKVKSEFRCEKLLLLYILDYIFFRSKII
jgi:DNA polymerase III delta prime subunit